MFGTFLTKFGLKNIHVNRVLKRNIFGWFKATKLEDYKTDGQYIEITKSNTDGNDSIDLKVTINKDKILQYNPKNDIIIKNYSSIISASESPILNGKSFAGTIEYIPKIVKARGTSRVPFEVGDRVWGLMDKDAWSQYISVDYSKIQKAPNNILLDYAGLFPIDLLTLYSCLFQSKYRKLNSLNGLSILFIGTGRRSMCNTFIPLLRKLGARTITVITSSDRHIDVLNKFDIDGLINSNNEDYTKIPGKFDIIIDSLAMYNDELKEHLKMAGNLSKYWLMNTPHYEIITKTNNQFQARKLIGKWLTDIQMLASQINHTCQVIPGELYQYNPLFLSEFSTFIDQQNLNFPIIIDKMFKINEINKAFQYINQNNEHILGQNIGLQMFSENNISSVDNVNTYYLDNIDSYMKEYQIRQQKLINDGYTQTSQSLKMYNI